MLPVSPGPFADVFRHRDHKRAITLPQQLFEQREHGAFVLLQLILLAVTAIDENADGGRGIFVEPDAVDDPAGPVVVDTKVVAREARDQAVLLVQYRAGDRHEL